jgi:hypothetical protein
MAKNIYIAVQMEDDGKFYAYVVKTTDNVNLLSVTTINNVISANILNKEKAYKVVEMWNEQFKQNGIYMFSSPSF